MLYILVLFIISSTVYAVTDPRPVIHLPSLVHDLVKLAMKDCSTETGAEPEVAKRFFQLKFGEDEISKKFLYCICRKTNYGDEDGHLNDGFMTLFASSDNKNGVQKVLENCNKIKKNNHIDTIYEVVQCFYKNTPVLLVE